MGDNATVVIESKCHDCDELIQFIQSGTNDWLVVCEIHGTVEPRAECGDATD